MPPEPPRCLRLRRSRGALRRQQKIHVRCFQRYVRYFTKQLKTLIPSQLTAKGCSARIVIRLCYNPNGAIL